MFACMHAETQQCLQMEDELEEEDDDLIGPAPPELVSEVENAGSDDRSKEVIRILRWCSSSWALSTLALKSSEHLHLLTGH